MGLVDWLQDTWKKTENIGPLEHRLMEKVAKRDSQTAAMLGNKLGWQWLENQGKQNEQDPTRALAHGAIGAAAYFAGPYLWGSGAAGKGAALAATEQGASQLGNVGMFAADQAPGFMTGAQAELVQQAAMRQAQEEAARQAAAEVAQQAAPQTLSSGGLFSGPSMMGPGGIPAAPGMESLAAKDAVSIAQAGGQYPSYGSYLGDRAKTELMNMDQPGEWGARLNRNLDRIAGKSSQNASMNLLQRSLAPQQPTYQPPPGMPQQQSRGPEQIVSPEERRRLMDDYNAGRISEDELRRRLGVYA